MLNLVVEARDSSERWCPIFDPADLRSSSILMATRTTTRKRRTATRTSTQAGTKSAQRAKRAGGHKRHARTRDPIAKLREICLALPEVVEVEAWGEPTFRVKNKIFAMHASAGSHHGAGRTAVWILSVNIEQDLVLRSRPDKYFKPPYVGPSGWIGAWLDRNPPWVEIAELLKDGYRRRAPKKLAALIDD